MRKKVIVFGTFDDIHAGHEDFLRQARTFGDYLIAVLPQDSGVEKLKGTLPKLTLAERMVHIKNSGLVDEAVAGDRKLGSWKVLEKYKPDVIALGFDQGLIREDLEKYFAESNWKAEIKVMKRFNKPYSAKF